MRIYRLKEGQEFFFVSKSQLGDIWFQWLLFEVFTIIVCHPDFIGWNIYGQIWSVILENKLLMIASWHEKSWREIF